MNPVCEFDQMEGTRAQIRVPATVTSHGNPRMPQQSRRSFVKNSALASAVFAAPASLRGATSPNDKIGACVVGVNGRGGSHIQAWLGDSRTEIVAIVDVDEDVGNRRCSAIEQKQGTRPQLYTDMRKAFENDAVDIVSTATPNHWHALTGIWAM
ncbi:MAG TPA: hypothetical protein DCG12_14870, partial [Planctomycetaceae bacterium]|nr:hypothetical protein [Planctomycetaceae bacterium]